MSGKQAKILSDQHIEDLLFFAGNTRQPERNHVIVLLSMKAGLRAAEIANLTWNMVIGPTGQIGTAIELHDNAAKKEVVAQSRCMLRSGTPWYLCAARNQLMVQLSVRNAAVE